MKQCRRLWILDGKPRGNNFKTFRDYKSAKSVFRRVHRKASEDFLKQLNQEIDTAAEIDAGYFWKLVNRRRNNQASTDGSQMKFGDKVYRDSEEICKQFGLYYASLYSETEHECFDQEHYNNVKRQVDTLKLREFDKRSVPLINENHISATIHGLSKGKACGSDLINNEHFIYNGRLLAILFNTMLIESYVPGKMKVGVIITIFKGGSKPRDDPNSYRAITLTSSILKLYETLWKNIIHSS